MKTGTHPQWYDDCQVTCSCGNTFTTGSTKPQIKVEVCSACHPFYTGQQKFVDSLGRVERFQAKLKATPTTPIVSKKKKRALKAIADDVKDAALPKSLKEMFEKKK
jgi:large subunit ribosomal protein L31